LSRIYWEKAFADIGGEIYVKVLPKKLDEEVASDMVAGFGGVITQLTKVDKPNTTQYYVYDYQGNRVRSFLCLCSGSVFVGLGFCLYQR
jgi:hypothetical protein